MYSIVKGLRIIFVALALSSLSACSWFDRILPEKDAAYKSSGKSKPLEVPPDLSKPSQNSSLGVPDINGSGSATYSGYVGADKKAAPGQATGSGVLAASKDIQYEHQGDKSWLVIKAKPEQVWPKVRDFLVQNGFLITVDNPEIGIMETDWAENRSKVSKGFFNSIFGGVFGGLYDSGLRDKFRIRMEKGADDLSVEVYIAHRGMQEVVQGSDNYQEGTRWTVRPSDPELEVEMLKRLMVALGMASEAAKQSVAESRERAPRARMDTSTKGIESIVLEQDFSRAWRYTGVALDRVGFSVEDRNRSKGIYYVRYSDADRARQKKGFFSGLFSSSDKSLSQVYQVLVREEGQVTRISIQDKDGKPDTSPTAKRILKLLQSQLK